MKKYNLLIMGIIAAVAMTACGKKSSDNEVSVPESTDMVDGMANPWTDSDRQGVLNATGIELDAPEGATDVYYSYMADENMAQLTYTLNGADWTYRAQPSGEFTDISGMYYEWQAEDSVTVANREATILVFSDIYEESEYIDGAYSVQVINWYDRVPGVMYSLSVTGTDIDGIDIQVYAEAVFSPMQKDASDDTEADANEELNTYFIGNHIRSYDESNVSIKDNGDGTYNVDISIIRLCSLEGGVGTYDEHKILFTIIDPAENEMQGMIYLDSDNSLIIEITDSTWEYLPAGEKLDGFGK